MSEDSCVEKRTIPNDKIIEAILLFSRRKAVSTVQIGIELGLNPSRSLDLTQHLVDEGLVGGSHKNNSTVRLDEFYSLTTEGVRAARSIREKRGSM
ncbi:MAG: hypothetical protein AYK19_03195 [Theionarchaea archaeon DG-70-1]|nr:MAG: hypothetical protein AYK19_03195 [Theionarchaea archaeon DG-70-1]